MPHAGLSVALMWVTEGPYLAISEGSMESAILSREKFDKRLGSIQNMSRKSGNTIRIIILPCHLYFHNTLTVLAVCDTEGYLLPSTEKASN